MSKRKNKSKEVYDVDESEDELDEFQNGKDKINLNGVDTDSDFEQDEDVLGLAGDEDEDEDEDEENDKQLAYLKEQERIMARKMKLQGGASDDDEEEEEEGRDKGVLEWGRRKGYGADVVDHEVMDDEADVLQEEEDEAMRLQREQLKKLRPEDFGLEADEDEDESEEDEEEEEEEEEEQPLEKRAAQEGKKKSGKKEPKPSSAAADVEVVHKALDGLTAAERMQYVSQDAPELLALLDELKGSLQEVRGRVEPLLNEVKAGGLATQQGLSYLEAKHLLLLSYCTNIVFYLMLKADGVPVQDHPVIQRLLQIRSYIEKIRPIDKQLSYQIQKLLRAVEVANKDGAADGAAAAGEDVEVTRYGPKPDQLMGAQAQEAADDGDGGAGGVYRPPKLNPTSMEADEAGARQARKEERRVKDAKRKAARSSLVRELAAEIGGNPEEIRETAAGFDSVAAIRQRQRLEARAAVEEDLFMRVPLSKEEAKKMKAQRRAGLSGHAIIDDFADEVDDLVEMSKGVESQRQGGGGNALTQLFQRHKVSQKYGADLEAEAQRQRISGDRDVPMREPLHERRAKYDAVAAKRAAKQGAFGMGSGEDDDAGDDRPSKRHREEDDFYQQAKAARQTSKQARKESHLVPDLLPPLLDETIAGPRKITTEIEKNRGLTPHRRKDLKNPRKKHRVHYDKAVVRRKGQVQDVRTQEAPYGGEKSGIKAKVSKSRRF